MKTLGKSIGALSALPVAAFLMLGGAGVAFASCTNTVINGTTVCVPNNDGGVGGGGGEYVGGGGSTTPNTAAPITGGNTAPAPLPPAPAPAPVPVVPAPVVQAPVTAPITAPVPVAVVPNQTAVNNIPSNPEVPVADTPVSVPATENSPAEVAADTAVKNDSLPVKEEAPTLSSETEAETIPSSVPSESSSPSSAPSPSVISIEQQSSEGKLPSWAGPVYLTLVVTFTVALATWAALLRRRLRKEKGTSK